MSKPKRPEEVVQKTGDFVTVTGDEIEQVKKQALLNERKRIRINLHHNSESSVHEMIIVHARGNYVRPHKHLQKSESFHVIEGELDVILFDDHGKVIRTIEMGPAPSGKSFCYRCIPDRWHSVIPRSELVVFHETTDGPFTPEGSVQAPWAPADTDNDAGNEYFKNLGLL